MYDVGVYPESMPEDWRKSPSGDFVSRQWLLNEYDKRHKGPPGGARKMIEEAPPADVRPVMYGEWEQQENGTWVCSRCKSWIPDEQHFYAMFCLHCGADMGGTP